MVTLKRVMTVWRSDGGLTVHSAIALTMHR